MQTAGLGDGPVPFPCAKRGAGPLPGTVPWWLRVLGTFGVPPAKPRGAPWLQLCNAPGSVPGC